DRLFTGATTAEIFDGGRRWLSIQRGARSERPSWILGRFEAAGIESREESDPCGNEPHGSPDGRWLAWGNWHERDVSIKRLGSHEPPVLLPMASSATVAFSPDGRLLAVGGAEEIRFHE